jgi:hypothetical protein
VPRTNTIAYYQNTTITAIKSFIIHAPVENLKVVFAEISTLCMGKPWLELPKFPTLDVNVGVPHTNPA